MGGAQAQFLLGGPAQPGFLLSSGRARCAPSCQQLTPIKIA